MLDFFVLGSKVTTFAPENSTRKAHFRSMSYENKIYVSINTHFSTSTVPQIDVDSLILYLPTTEYLCN